MTNTVVPPRAPQDPYLPGQRPGGGGGMEVPQRPELPFPVPEQVPVDPAGQHQFLKELEMNVMALAQQKRIEQLQQIQAFGQDAPAMAEDLLTRMRVEPPTDHESKSAYIQEIETLKPFLPPEQTMQLEGSFKRLTAAPEFTKRMGEELVKGATKDNWKFGVGTETREVTRTSRVLDTKEKVRQVKNPETGKFEDEGGAATGFTKGLFDWLPGVEATLRGRVAGSMMETIEKDQVGWGQRKYSNDPDSPTVWSDKMPVEKQGMSPGMRKQLGSEVAAGLLNKLVPPESKFDTASAWGSALGWIAPATAMEKLAIKGLQHVPKVGKWVGEALSAGSKARVGAKLVAGAAVSGPATMLQAAWGYQRPLDKDAQLEIDAAEPARKESMEVARRTYRAMQEGLWNPAYSLGGGVINKLFRRARGVTAAATAASFPAITEGMDWLTNEGSKALAGMGWGGVDELADYYATKGYPKLLSDIYNAKDSQSRIKAIEAYAKAAMPMGAAFGTMHMMQKVGETFGSRAEMLSHLRKVEEEVKALAPDDEGVATELMRVARQEAEAVAPTKAQDEHRAAVEKVTEVLGEKKGPAALAHQAIAEKVLAHVPGKSMDEKEAHLMKAYGKPDTPPTEQTIIDLTLRGITYLRKAAESEAPGPLMQRAQQLFDEAAVRRSNFDLPKFASEKAAYHRKLTSETHQAIARAWDEVAAGKSIDEAVEHVRAYVEPLGDKGLRILEAVESRLNKAMSVKAATQAEAPALPDATPITEMRPEVVGGIKSLQMEAQVEQAVAKDAPRLAETVLEIPKDEGLQVTKVEDTPHGEVVTAKTSAGREVIVPRESLGEHIAIPDVNEEQGTQLLQARAAALATGGKAELSFRDLGAIGIKSRVRQHRLRKQLVEMGLVEIDDKGVATWKGAKEAEAQAKAAVDQAKARAKIEREDLSTAIKDYRAKVGDLDPKVVGKAEANLTDQLQKLEDRKESIAGVLGEVDAEHLASLAKKFQGEQLVRSIHGAYAKRISKTVAAQLASAATAKTTREAGKAATAASMAGQNKLKEQFDVFVRTVEEQNDFLDQLAVRLHEEGAGGGGPEELLRRAHRELYGDEEKVFGVKQVCVAARRLMSEIREVMAARSGDGTAQAEQLRLVLNTPDFMVARRMTEEGTKTWQEVVDFFDKLGAGEDPAPAASADAPKSPYGLIKPEHLQALNDLRGQETIALSDGILDRKALKALEKAGYLTMTPERGRYAINWQAVDLANGQKGGVRQELLVGGAIATGWGIFGVGILNLWGSGAGLGYVGGAMAGGALVAAAHAAVHRAKWFVSSSEMIYRGISAAMRAAGFGITRLIPMTKKMITRLEMLRYAPYDRTGNIQPSHLPLLRTVFTPKVGRYGGVIHELLAARSASNQDIEVFTRGLHVFQHLLGHDQEIRAAFTKAVELYHYGLPPADPNQPHPPEKVAELRAAEAILDKHNPEILASGRHEWMELMRVMRGVTAERLPEMVQAKITLSALEKIQADIASGAQDVAAAVHAALAEVHRHTGGKRNFSTRGLPEAKRAEIAEARRLHRNAQSRYRNAEKNLERIEDRIRRLRFSMQQRADAWGRQQGYVPAVSKAFLWEMKEIMREFQLRDIGLRDVDESLELELLRKGRTSVHMMKRHDTLEAEGMRDMDPIRSSVHYIREIMPKLHYNQWLMARGQEVFGSHQMVDDATIGQMADVDGRVLELTPVGFVDRHYYGTALEVDVLDPGQDTPVRRYYKSEDQLSKVAKNSRPVVVHVFGPRLSDGRRPRLPDSAGALPIGPEKGFTFRLHGQVKHNYWSTPRGGEIHRWQDSGNDVHDLVRAMSEVSGLKMTLAKEEPRWLEASKDVLEMMNTAFANAAIGNWSYKATTRNLTSAIAFALPHIGVRSMAYVPLGGQFIAKTAAYMISIRNKAGMIEALSGPDANGRILAVKGLRDALQTPAAKLAKMKPGARKHQQMIDAAMADLAVSPWQSSMASQFLSPRVSDLKGINPRTLPKEFMAALAKAARSQDPKDFHDALAIAKKHNVDMKSYPIDSGARHVMARIYAGSPYVGSKGFAAFDVAQRMANASIYICVHVTAQQAGKSPAEARALADNAIISVSGYNDRAAASMFSRIPVVGSLTSWITNMSRMVWRSLVTVPLRLAKAQGGRRVMVRGMPLSTEGNARLASVVAMSIGKHMLGLYLLAQAGQMAGFDITQMIGSKSSSVPGIGTHLDRAVDTHWNKGLMQEDASWRKALSSIYAPLGRVGLIDGSTPLPMFAATWSPFAFTALDDHVDLIQAYDQRNDRKADQAMAQIMRTAIMGWSNVYDLTHTRPDPDTPGHSFTVEPFTGRSLSRIKDPTLMTTLMRSIVPDMTQSHNFKMRSIRRLDEADQAGERASEKWSYQSMLMESNVLKRGGHVEAANQIEKQAVESIIKDMVAGGHNVKEIKRYLAEVMESAESNVGLDSLDRDVLSPGKPVAARIRALTEQIKRPDVQMTKQRLTKLITQIAGRGGSSLEVVARTEPATWAAFEAALKEWQARQSPASAAPTSRPTMPNK